MKQTARNKVFSNEYTALPNYTSCMIQAHVVLYEFIFSCFPLIEHSKTVGEMIVNLFLSKTPDIIIQLRFQLFTWCLFFDHVFNSSSISTYSCITRQLILKNAPKLDPTSKSKYGFKKNCKKQFRSYYFLCLMSYIFYLTNIEKSKLYYFRISTPFFLCLVILLKPVSDIETVSTYVCFLEHA